jgi:hypothetical protein
MPDSISRREFVKNISLGTALFGAGTAMLLQSACGGSENTNNAQAISERNANESLNSNVGTQSTNAGGNANMVERDETADNIVQVVDRWSGVEVGTFQRGLSFSGLWVQRHPLTTPYNPVGIDRLINELRGNTFFKNHPRVGQLKRGQFISGGGIQTEGNLYDFFTT